MPTMPVVQQNCGQSLAHREAALQGYTKRVLADALLARCQATASNLASNPESLPVGTPALLAHALAQAMAHELQAIASTSAARVSGIPLSNANRSPSTEAKPNVDVETSTASSLDQAMLDSQVPRNVGSAASEAPRSSQTPTPEIPENEAALSAAAAATSEAKANAEAVAAARRTNERAADLRLLLLRGVRRGCADSLLLSREAAPMLKAALGSDASLSAENKAGHAHGTQTSVSLDEMLSPELLAATQRVVRTVAHVRE